MKRSSRARILSALLTLAMVFTMLPAAWAAEGPGDDPTLHDESITLSIEGDSHVTVDSSVSLSVSEKVLLLRARFSGRLHPGVNLSRLKLALRPRMLALQVSPRVLPRLLVRLKSTASLIAMTSRLP